VDMPSVGDVKILKLNEGNSQKLRRLIVTKVNAETAISIE